MHIELLNLGFTKQRDGTYLHGEHGIVVKILDKDIYVTIDGKDIKATMEELEKVVIYYE